MTDQTPYGVDWPEHFETTPESERESSSKFDVGLRRTKKDLGKEMDRMGVEGWYLDEEMGSGGFPGVVIHWQKDGLEYAVACDRYQSRKANLREAYLWIHETRMRADRPVQTGQDEFAAAQLPPGDADEPIAAGPATDDLDEDRAAELLGVRTDAPEDAIRGAAERQIRTGHPDHGGDADVAQIKKARDLLLES